MTDIPKIGSNNWIQAKKLEQPKQPETTPANQNAKAPEKPGDNSSLLNALAGLASMNKPQATNNKRTFDIAKLGELSPETKENLDKIAGNLGAFHHFCQKTDDLDQQNAFIAEFC